MSKYIFSGDASLMMWDEINATYDNNDDDNNDVHYALYNIGCKCQVLESLVRELEKKIKDLEDIVEDIRYSRGDIL